MFTLFKLGFDVVVLVLLSGGAFFVGVKVEQKWPGKVAELFAFLSPKSTTTNS